MPEIALYYPYTHIRSETWLKAAALYLSKLALIAPPGYPRRLSNTADVLRDELDFLVDVDPSRRAHDVALDFLELIRSHGDALSARYAWPERFPPELYIAMEADGFTCGDTGFDGRVEWIHVGKFPSKLADALVATKLGKISDDGVWVAVHPRLGAVYLAALADRMAQANDMPVITDQPQAYGTLNGWTLDTLARVLLGDETEDLITEEQRPAGQVAMLFAALAIETVVPAGIEHIPVRKIVQVRRTLGAEFDAFIAHLDAMSAQFADLARIEDPVVLTARLRILVERDLRRPTAELDKSLRQLDLQPARAVLAMKSAELPAAAAAAAAGFGVPLAVGQAGLVAAQFFASTAQARQLAEQRRRSAVGYLLGLRDQLSPTGTIERLRRIIRRAED